MVVLEGVVVGSKGFVVVILIGVVVVVVLEGAVVVSKGVVVLISIGVVVSAGVVVVVV